MTSIPCRRNTAPGPMPDSCRICGEPMAPAARITSRRATSRSLVPTRRTPVARPPGVTRFDHEPLDLRLDPHCQIRPRHDRTQIRLGSAPAPATTLVHLKVGVPEVVAPIEFGDLRNPTLRRCIAPRLENLPADPLLLDAHLATDPMKLIGAVLVVLRPLEHREHVVPAPPAVAKRRPVVVVGLLTAHVDHRVDRRAPAQHLATRVADGPPVQTRVGFRSCSTSRCGDCRSCRDSQPGYRSRSSRPCRRLRARAR